MEPDTFPILPQWTEKIYWESVCGEDFWIKGGTLRINHFSHIRAYGNHINGNALYNTNDPGFWFWINYVARPDKSKEAYDVMFWRMWMRSLIERKQWSAKYQNKYKQVSWLWNQGNKYDTGRDWKSWVREEVLEQSPNTYFVHGNIEKPKKEEQDQDELAPMFGESLEEVKYIAV